MRNALSVLAVCLAAVVHADFAEAQWKPPVGIPNPPFGITNTAPSRPAVWTTPVTGYYYVDATVAGATDTSNPYGTPARPRRTIPETLPAGSVVEVHGTYSNDHTSPHGIVSSGTAAAPVYIRGQSATLKPNVTSCWQMAGTYFVVENLEFSTCGSVVFLSPTNHAALRHSDIHGTLAGGGVGVLSWNGLTASNVVLWDNLIHDNGDVNATYDQDVHGIAVSANVNHLWVVDNQMYRNSGDGIQINAGSLTAQPTTHHIFVGRNISHDNKQTGFWTKQAVDVIFSENVSYSHRPGNSSMGVCMGGQYAPDFVWFIDNVMWDCDFGIQLASDAGQGSGRASFFIGNVIMQIHDSINSFQPGSAWQNCGISLPGGVYRFVMENDLYDVDSGVCIPYSAGKLYLFDNLVEKIRSDGHHVMFDTSTMRDNTTAGSNLFAPDFHLGVGGVEEIYPAAPRGPVGDNSPVATIGWVNPGAGDVRLSATSPAIAFGLMNRLGIWQYYLNRYGVPLSVDIVGTPRDTTTTPDAGAIER